MMHARKNERRLVGSESGETSVTEHLVSASIGGDTCKPTTGGRTTDRYQNVWRAGSKINLGTKDKAVPSLRRRRVPKLPAVCVWMCKCHLLRSELDRLSYMADCMLAKGEMS